MSSQNILQQIQNSHSLLPASRDRPQHHTRSPLAKISTNRNLCDRQPTISTDKDDLFANYPIPARSAIAPHF